MKTHLSFLLLLLIGISAWAQTPAAPGKNLITNGGFEQFYTRDNLWDGVNSDGYLAGLNVIDPEGGAAEFQRSGFQAGWRIRSCPCL